MDITSLDWINAYPDGTLECTGVGGKRVFEVRTRVIDDSKGTGFDYFVRPVSPPDTSGCLYVAVFHQVQDGLMQVDSLDNPLPEAYKHCGITRALFAKVTRERGLSLRSSQRRVEDEERRSDEATAMWEGMVRDNLARYDESEDRFYYEGARGELPRR